MCLFKEGESLLRAGSYGKSGPTAKDFLEQSKIGAWLSLSLKGTKKEQFAALNLSQEQKVRLLGYRKNYLQRLSLLLKQRWELHRLMMTHFPREKDVSFRTSHAKATEAADRLYDNLRQEQTLLIQSLCASHQQILAPEQTCAHIITAYPYYPDIPMLVEEIAHQTPGEVSAATLLGVQTLPPIDVIS